MKKISKRLTVVIAVLLTAALSLCAGTTVYLFVPALGNMDVTLLIDGEEVCDLNTPVGKTTNFHTFKIPSTQSKKGWVEIEFGQEGKVLRRPSLIWWTARLYMSIWHAKAGTTASSNSLTKRKARRNLLTKRPSGFQK